MTDIARSVGGETDIDRILELIVDRGRALVQARALLIMIADGDELVMEATAGDLEPDLRGRRISTDGTLPGRVLRDGRAERLGEGRGEEGLADLGVPAEAAILVPLTFRGVSSGVLVALDRQADGPGFGLEDERLLRSFAASAATAVATAKSVEADRLRHSLEAAEQERKRWARELHDETLQALGGLRMLHSTGLRGDADAAELRDGVEGGDRPDRRRDRQPLGADRRAAPRRAGRDRPGAGAAHAGGAQGPRGQGRDRRPRAPRGRRHPAPG